MATHTVVLTDQVFPDTDYEHEKFAEIDAELIIADGSPDDVAAKAPQADALLTTYFPIDAELIDSLDNCKIIARYGIGVDSVDLQAAADKRIVVTNVPDYSVQEVSAHALALILDLLRKVSTGDRYVRSGGWAVSELRPMRRLSTLTVGLLGYGRIARRLAVALEALEMNVIVYDPYVTAGPELVDLDELFDRSDVLSVHAPLTPETRGIVNAESLAQLPDHAVVVNTSRGPLIDVDALFDALRSGTIAGAGLDVLDVEPVDLTRIDGVPNLIITPHMAYYSEEALQESQRKATTQVLKVLQGQEPDYPVRP